MIALMQLALERSHTAYRVRLLSCREVGKGQLVIAELIPHNSDDRWLTRYQRVAYFSVEDQLPRLLWDMIAN